MSFPFENIRSAAQDKLMCKCGNKEWTNFVYISAGINDPIAAGCKVCATIYEYVEKKWVKRKEKLTEW